MENERLTLTIKEAAKVLGISRGTAYEAARQNKIPVIKIGRRLLVPRKALMKFLEGGTGEK